MLSSMIDKKISLQADFMAGVTVFACKHPQTIYTSPTSLPDSRKKGSPNQSIVSLHI
jgi:hypothetical protein